MSITKAPDSGCSAINAYTDYDLLSVVRMAQGHCDLLGQPELTTLEIAV